MLSWAEFCGRNHRFAHALSGAGVGLGDRVGIVMSNGLPMLQALFGSMAAGACTVPINLSVSDDALVSMLQDAQVSALVVSDDQLPRLQALESQLPAEVIRIAETPKPGWYGIEAFCDGQDTSLPRLDIADVLPLNIIYSSGTTGLPKGIVHTHRGRLDWAYDLSIALRYHGGARTLLTIGLYSNISWVAMLCTLLAGGTLVVQRHFDAVEFVRAVGEVRVTHTAMVPIQFQRVIELLKREGGDVSSMQAMMSCGSPLHAELKRELFEFFPCGIVELYGLTEGIITTLDPEDAEGRWASVGKPLIGTDIRIIDGDDRECEPGQSGEIVSRGRITMPGYWNRPDATRDATYIDNDGVTWIRTGDIGQLDEQGFLQIVDRKKDMILSGGQNIYPQDLESVLIEHEEVNDVAVIGLSSERWGETPVALVVMESGSDADCRAILEWANARLGKQQRLADLIAVDELPRNPNGKILKRELRESFKYQSYG